MGPLTTQGTTHCGSTNDRELDSLWGLADILHTCKTQNKCNSNNKNLPTNVETNRQTLHNYVDECYVEPGITVHWVKFVALKVCHFVRRVFADLILQICPTKTGKMLYNKNVDIFAINCV